MLMGLIASFEKQVDLMILLSLVSNCFQIPQGELDWEVYRKNVDNSRETIKAVSDSFKQVSNALMQLST